MRPMGLIIMKSKIQDFQSPKGMHDILPQDQALWDKVRKELQYISDQVICIVPYKRYF